MTTTESTTTTFREPSTDLDTVRSDLWVTRRDIAEWIDDIRERLAAGQTVTRLDGLIENLQELLDIDQS